MEAFRKADVEAALAGGGDHEPARVLAHEICHWLDIVGTTWGQTYLDQLFRTYDEMLSNPAPAIKGFPAALAQFDLDRGILFPSYYKFVGRRAQPRTGPGTWSMENTTGERIGPDGRPSSAFPIFFVRFWENDAEVARQPITVGSLLELRAINTELRTFVELPHDQPPDERKVTENLFTREIVAQLYHPELTTYSAGAHLVSSFMFGGDAAMAHSMGAHLADIALNLTNGHLARMRYPAAMIKHVPPSRLRGFRLNGDRGFAFAALCYHLHASQSTKASTAVVEVLQAAGLPDLATIYGAAETFIERRRVTGFASPELARIREALRAAGIEVVRARQTTPEGMTFEAWPNLPMPYVIDNEMEELGIGRRVLDEDDTLFLTGCSQALDTITRQALRAGRGFEFGFSDFVY